MEGTHTVLRLYKPIHELCFISLYFPTRKSRGLSRAGHSPREVQPLQRDEDPARTKQRPQYYKSADEVFQSCEATKGAVAQLQWLAAERHQLLTDLLSLCSDCADRLRMGNQDGKLQEEHGVSSSNLTLSPCPEQRRATSRVRKLKKLGSKKVDSAEEFLQSMMKKKVQSGAASEFSQLNAPGTPVSIHGPDTPGSGSYISVSSDPFLPMDEHFHIAHDGWDFIEEPRSFECEMDCNELSEFGELCLEYEKPHVDGGNSSGNHQEKFGSDNMARKDNVLLNEEPVSRSCLDVEGIYQKSAGHEEINRFTQVNEDQVCKKTVDANSRSSNLRSWTRSPTSSSLSGVFNVSYPACNSLQSMSPVLSPLSSQLPSPQMNHRIVLLPEEDDGNKRSSRDEPKVTTEVIDKNGNRRTVTRLDLNLGNHFSLNGASTSSATTSGKRPLFCFKLKKKLCAKSNS